VVAPRVAVLHDHRGLLNDVVRICFRHRASFHLARSQRELMDLVSSNEHRVDLVIAKDVVPDDWFTVGGVLLGARAAGLHMPFIVVGDASDRWTKQLVEVASPAAIIDERESRQLVPLVLVDWLERVHRVQVLGPKCGVFRRGDTSRPIRVRREHFRVCA
jgi:hypothetical protein